MEMEFDYSLTTADSVQYELECGISALSAIQIAMEYGPSEPSSYTDALFGIYNYLGMLNRKLRGCLDAEFAEREKAPKQEKTAGTPGVAA